MERERDDATEAQARPRPAVLNSQRLLAGGLALVAALVVVIAVLSFQLGSNKTTNSSKPAASPSPSNSASPTVSDIFRQAGPSVVVIRTPKTLGTGVVAADNGTVLTANHVITGATSINITFSDGTTVGASVAASNPAQDIAALTPSSLPEILVPATLGGGVAVGAPVVAIGNPLGLTYSVSSGVVSGLDREADTDNGDFGGLIQFDASVNPGSSGGPLLDADGLVVGIVVSIADPGRDDAFAGIGFAVPIGAALAGGDGNGPGGGPQI